MKVTPSLVTHNRFSVLAVDNDIKTTAPPIVVVPEPPPVHSDPPERLFPRPRWERNRLPRHFTIAGSSSPSLNSLDLDIELRTTDSGQAFRTSALVDSGATGSFIDRDFVTRNNIATRRLSHPVPVLKRRWDSPMRPDRSRKSWT